MMFIALASIVLYQISFKDELADADRSLEQLVTTVQSSASIAAYLGDKELAKEVITGLSNSDMVDSVLIINQEKVLFSDGSHETAVSRSSQRFSLLSPFIASETVGELIIYPNQQLIEQKAASSAFRFVISMLVYSFFLVAVLIPLVNWQLTRPIKKLAGQLHSISPGSEDRLHYPRGHDKDEIGNLVQDTNELLNSVQQMLDKERNLRHVIEQLQDKFRLVFDNASCGIALIDYDGRAHMHNNSFAQIFGSEYLKNDESFEQLSLISFFEHKSEFIEALDRARFSDLPIGVDFEVHRVENHPARWLHCLLSRVYDESIGRFIELIVYDVSERAHRERQAQIAAEHDPLTQLFNRRAGVVRMQEAMDEATQGNNKCALLMIDLDHFKPINDKHGHEAGDQVLIEVARRLHQCIRGEDMVIRWGGDEFMVFLVTGHGPLNPRPVADKLLKQLPKPIRLQSGAEVVIGASIGIALFPDHGNSVMQLIEVADEMMYDVKTSGRNAYQLAS